MNPRSAPVTQGFPFKRVWRWFLSIVAFGCGAAAAVASLTWLFG